MGTDALLVLGPQGERRIELRPGGMIIGRTSSCDIVLEDASVSRQHARVCQDPFGRWLLEDLSSHNGVWIGSQRVTQRPLAGGERVRIGPFTLVLQAQTGRQIAPDPFVTVSSRLVDDGAERAAVRTKESPGESLSHDRIRHLNEIADRLSALGRSSELYPELCAAASQALGAEAAVLRLPPAGSPLAGPPQVLAFQPSPGQSLAEAPDVRFSRRVLEAARASDRPVMASSAPSAQGVMDLTRVGDAGPRTVLCAALGRTQATVDLLYLDSPARLEDGTDLLDFVQAVARQAGFAAKSLVAAEEHADRRLLDQQLELARVIQTELSPKGLESLEALDVAFHYQPALWVGGDYCDVWPLEDGAVAFAIGDVAGKGLPAALVMANLHAAMRVTTSFCRDPAEVVNRLNQHLARHTPDEMFVTLVLGVFDGKTGQLQYVNAGHIPPAVLAGGRAEQLGKPCNPPLGLLDRAFVAQCHQLDPGSGLIVVTDGVTEAASQGGEPFGYDRFCQVARQAGTVSAQALVTSVAQAALDFRRPWPQQDDITVFALVNRPASPRA